MMNSRERRLFSRHRVPHRLGKPRIQIILGDDQRDAVEFLGLP
jgi:hypothetical protein